MIKKYNIVHEMCIRDYLISLNKMVEDGWIALHETFLIKNDTWNIMVVREMDKQ